MPDAATRPVTGQAAPTAILGFTGRIDSRRAVLARALASWAGRTGDADARARRAAGDAMDTIDAMLRELHTLRQCLSVEIRGSDDAAAARADEILAQAREAAQAPDGTDAWLYR